MSTLGEGKAMQNRITLVGMVKSLPQRSHTLYGESFWRFEVDVPRLSGVVDTLPVIISEHLLPEWPLQEGMDIAISGQVRSHHQVVDGVNRLFISVFACEMEDAADQENGYMNVVELEGYLCKGATHRMTPMQREICDLLLAVHRAYHRSDYIPCIAWGRNARLCAPLAAGSRIRIEGRLQGRTYQKQTEAGAYERVVYEVSAGRITLFEEEQDQRDATRETRLLL